VDFQSGSCVGNGAGTPALLLATLVVPLAFSVSYTTMARHVTNSGGFYAFYASGLGGLSRTLNVQSDPDWCGPLLSFL
jgi:amino acid transporter